MRNERDYDTMIKLGEYQNMEIVRIKEQGAYLREPETSEEILLPGKQIPEGAAIGDTVRVFLYRDSKDRLIATTAEPKITMGQVKRLRVAEMTKIGAFLDWGLEKDLLLPFREMTGEIKAGDEILVALYIDKSERLAATMKLYPYLKLHSPYQTDDTVKGTVYENTENFGVFVAVDDEYSGLIPKKDVLKTYKVGETLDFRVTGVKEDGKLDLSTRDKAYLEINSDAEAVLSVIREDYSGELPFDDKADPERIREVFGLSKAAFKRAVGHLYKERIITLEEGTIRVL